VEEVMAEIAQRMREILTEAKKGKKGEKLTISFRGGSPMDKKIRNEPKFRKLLKKIKKQEPYKTKAAAKRAFLAGLIRKMAGEDVEYTPEETALLEFIDTAFEIDFIED
jgi:hypothetical protein